MGRFKHIWSYRFFILSSIKMEFVSRFARSGLGAMWIILHPLAQVTIYALILSAVLKAKLPNIDNQFAYAIYLMAGMLTWSLFSEVFSRSLNAFIDNGNLIKKMSFPKIALPIIVTGSALINNTILLVVIIGVFGILGHMPTMGILWLPLLMVITVALALGIGLTLGIINVFMRDTGQIVSIVLQFWFWLTPIVYVIDVIPETYRDYLYINPLTGIVVNYHSILVYGGGIDFGLVAYPSVLAILSIGLAAFIYMRASGEMADAL